MHIVITGSSSITNLGDQAILICMMQDMRKVFGDNIQFTILSHFPEIAEKRIGHYPGVKQIQKITWLDEPALDWRIAFGQMGLFLAKQRIPLLNKYQKYAKSLEAIRNCDLLAIVGGRHLVSPYFYNLLRHSIEVIEAKRHGASVVAWSQSIGPFVTVKEKAVAGAFLNKLDLICPRDVKSYEFLKHFALSHPRIERTADCAFNLPVASDKEVDQALAKENIVRKDKPLVVMTARTLRFTISGIKDEEGENYLTAMARTADEVGTKMADLIFLSSTYKEPPYDRHDPDIGREIQKRMKHPDVLHIVENEYPAPVLKGMYSRMDLVVTTRMHPIIFTSATNTPVLGIAYEYKSQELFNLLQLEKYCLQAQSLNAETLIERIGDALENADSIREHLSNRIPELQKMAFSCAEYTKELVENNHNS